ncbi:hypothetical protein GT045_05865 [Streptomyces sp. SID486]|uniref:hypothetical protein n=1 Tax=unclassified Streptomyces TaxID=2593676 RepID=UPI00136D3AF9|nr:MULTISPECIES: hypothetical protein [unclassified Streptomyces]MYW48251.1 hypothetical protein [Streptomyces sp. SID161]MYX94345.1 hypothetical protein [Streptomyces sp. SID486]
MRKPRTIATALAGTALLFLPLLLAVGAGPGTGDLPWTGISAQRSAQQTDLPWT